MKRESVGRPTLRSAGAALALLLLLFGPAVSASGEEDPFPFRLDIHGRVQTLWKMHAQEDDAVGLGDAYSREGFRVPRWRLGVEGEVYRYVSFTINVGETDNRREEDVNILDAAILIDHWLEYPRNHTFLRDVPDCVWSLMEPTIIAGAYKTPFGRNHMTSSRDLQTIFRPVLSTQIFVSTPIVEGEAADPRVNGIGLPDRGVGLQFRGKQQDGYVSYAFSILNGQGEIFRGDLNDEYAYTARLMLNPLGGFPLAEGDFDRDLKVGVGGSYFYNKVFDARYQGWGADLDIRWYGASLRFEYLWSQGEPTFAGEEVDPIIREKTVRQGWYVQGGVFVWPNYLELVARYEEFDDNNRLQDNGDIRYTTIGGNWYIKGNHYYKLQINYLWREEDGPKIDNDALYALLQVGF